LGVAPGTWNDLAFLDRRYPVPEKGLPIEDFLQIPAQLYLEAVAAQPGAHVEIGRLRRLGASFCPLWLAV
jgi:hypothetical protein